MTVFNKFLCVLSVKTRGMPSNSLNGNTTSLPPDDLVHISGPITEDTVLGALRERSAAGENYVCEKYCFFLSVNPVHALFIFPQQYCMSCLHLKITKLKIYKSSGPLMPELLPVSVA